MDRDAVIHTLLLAQSEQQAKGRQCDYVVMTEYMLEELTYYFLETSGMSLGKGQKVNSVLGMQVITSDILPENTVLIGDMVKYHIEE